jgi:hypothetical protein
MKEKVKKVKKKSKNVGNYFEIKKSNEKIMENFIKWKKMEIFFR